MTGERPRRVSRPRALFDPALLDYLQHDDLAVSQVLAAAFHLNDRNTVAVRMVADALGPLPLSQIRAGIENVAAELNLADRVEACSSRDELEHVTGVHSRSLSWRDDAEYHAQVVRDDARMQAEQLVDRARKAEEETER